MWDRLGWTAVFVGNLLMHTIVIATPIYVPQFLPGSTGRNIRHLPCVSRRTGETGVCMFAFTCAKANGTHLGTCIDRFYFGSCCKIEEEPEIFPQDNSIDDGPPARPFVTTLGPIESNDIPEYFSRPKPIAEKKPPGTHTTEASTSTKVTPTTHLITDASKQPTKFITKKPIYETTTSATGLTTFQTVQNVSTQELTTQTTSRTIATTTENPLKTSNVDSTTITTTQSLKPSSYKPTTTAETSTTVFATTQTSPAKPMTKKPIHLSTQKFQTTQKPTTTTPRPVLTTQRIPSTRFPPRNTTTVKPSTQTTTKRPTISNTKRPTTSVSTKRPTVTTKKPNAPPKRPISKPTIATLATTTVKPSSVKVKPTVLTTESTLSVPSSGKPTESTTASSQKTTVSSQKTTVSSQKTTVSSQKTTASTTAKEPIDLKTTTPKTTTAKTTVKITAKPTNIGTTTVRTTFKTTTVKTTTVETTPVGTTTVKTTSEFSTTTEKTKPLSMTTDAVMFGDTRPRPTTSSVKPSMEPSTEPSTAATSSFAATVATSATASPSTKSPEVNQTGLEEVPVTTSSPGLVTWSSNSDESTRTPDATSTIADQGEQAETEWTPITTPDGWIMIQSPTTEKPAQTEEEPMTKPITESTVQATASDKPVTTTEYVTKKPTTPPSSSTVMSVTVDTELPVPMETLNMTDYKQVCGRRLFPEARIVGGKASSFGMWPWQISLRQWRTSTYLHKCGAALLNENWAITAAHCVENVPPSDLLLRIGEHDLANEEEPYGFQERRVQIVASHPQFDPRTFEYDLALLRFYEPVLPFQPNIVPICLPDDDETYVGRTAYVTGWGRLYDEGPLPSVLQEVAVPVVNNSVCETMYRTAGYVEHIPHIFICAGWKNGGFDSCEGDSGGPMVIKRARDKRWILAGVISWGIGCAMPNQPGVYTRISEFREWINQILQF